MKMPKRDAALIGWPSEAMEAVLICASAEADCRMFAEWLLRAAKVEANWVKALQNAEFRDQVADLCGFADPNFEACALQLLADIKSRSDMIVLRFDLNNFGNFWTHVDAVLRIEFTMMVKLGFFEFINNRCEMAIPKITTTEWIKQVALEIATNGRADGDDFIIPETLLNTMSAQDAEAERLKFLAISRFEDDHRYDPAKAC
jgi:hypothetical protein